MRIETGFQAVHQEGSLSSFTPSSNLPDELPRAPTHDQTSTLFLKPGADFSQRGDPRFPIRRSLSLERSPDTES